MRNNFRFLYITLAFIALMAGVVGCKKDAESFTPEQVAFFLAKPANGNYSIVAPNSNYKVLVGLTAPSGQERTVNVSVSSPSGAVAGTHYTLSKSTIVIPAGKVVDSFEVRGVLSQYQAGRKDTLVFTISGGETDNHALSKNFTLVVTGPCFEGNVNLATLLGSYRNTMEDFGGAYGPYTTTISAVNQLTPTTGTITVTNLYDNGWNPVTFILDWTNPAARTVTLTPQTGIGDAGTINPTYTGQDIQVRPHAIGGAGTFSVCNQTITLKLQLGVTGLGFFGGLYTVNMAR